MTSKTPIELDLVDRWEARGPLYLVRSPFHMSRAEPELLGRQVMLEGRAMKVVRIFSTRPSGPIREGELVALEVEAVGG